jgi:hypothetical protein
LITKTLEDGTVIFVAETPRADQWMRRRYGALTRRVGRFRQRAMVFRTDTLREKKKADTFEADARALHPPLAINTGGS